MPNDKELEKQYNEFISTVENKTFTDPLDKYMISISNDLKKNVNKTCKQKAARLDFEDSTVKSDSGQFPISNMHIKPKRYDYDSDKEVYSAAKKADKVKNNENKILYDEYGNPLLKSIKNKKIKLLKNINDTMIVYPKYRKHIYFEHEKVKTMSTKDIENIYNKYQISCIGENIPNPCIQFYQFGFSDRMLQKIKKSFLTPTPIQMQAVPIILSGRDIIGVAKTGSGKTLAYIWPMIKHIITQRPVKKNEGPISMIIVPTHELSKQIYEVSLPYFKIYKIKSCPLFGGINMFEITNKLVQGVEVIVGTPGRIIELIDKNILKCERITFLVLDEADRMLDMGFDKQISSIISRIRDDRQTLLFSATMVNSVERLASSIVKNKIRVNVGIIGGANKDIKQVVEVFLSEEMKWTWLLRSIKSFIEIGRVLIFVSTIDSCERTCKNLKKYGVAVDVIHGNFASIVRNKIIKDFKKKKIKVLVATDVAARGLDIKGLETVINYDCAKNIETHVNRIGRTGRAGENGVAYTLLANSKIDKVMASKLIKNLREAGQNINSTLMQYATNQLLMKRKSNKKMNDINRENKGISLRPPKGKRKFVSNSDLIVGGLKKAKESFKNSFVKSKNKLL